MELVLFALGFSLGIWFFTVVVLPVFYGVPKSLVWALRGWVRWRACAFYLIAPVLWNFVFFGAAAALVVFFPSAAIRLRESSGFGIGEPLGLRFSFGSTLFTASTRRNMRDDFLEFVRPYLTPKAPTFGEPKGSPTAADLNKLAVPVADLNKLAGLYLAEGKYAQAELVYKRALAIEEKALGPDHPDLAKSLHNLALLYATQGQYAQAEPLYKRALAIMEKALDPDDPSVAKSLNNLAALYATQGQYAQAELLFKRALAIREKALGPDDPSVAKSLENMAALYREISRVKEAEDLEKRAAAIRAIRR